MSNTKVFGSPQSRAFRALWMVHELGIPYENITDTKKPDYAAVNPNAKVPALQDGDVTLFESMAINLYLAQKHDKGLWPKNLGDIGRAYQWSFWVMTEVEKPVLTLLLDVIGMVKATPEALAEAKKTLEKPFGILDKALAGRDYLLGGNFTVADLNVASVVAWARGAKYDLARWPNLLAWLDRCTSRPAASAARKG